MKNYYRILALCFTFLIASSAMVHADTPSVGAADGQLAQGDTIPYSCVGSHN